MFFGRATVLADLRLHKTLAGLVTPGTLTLNGGGGTVAYANVCLWPPQEATGLGGNGAATLSGTLTAWRVGESQAPRVDDKWTVAGVGYLVVGVAKRHSHDEAAGYAIYDCSVTRMA